MSKPSKNLFGNLSSDIPSGIVVFLVALPLCLGIAFASGAPLFAGLISGIIGGIVIGAASGSQLSVSGPAAGLIVIVLTAIADLGSYEKFLLAVFLAGLMQMGLGFAKAGVIGHYFPSGVIKGMLAAIGLTLILKQIPHALGDDKDYEGDDSFFQPDGENTFTEIILAVQNISPGALMISLISVFILLAWELPTIKKLKFAKIVPGPLVVVVFGIVMNKVYQAYAPPLYLSGDHLVSLEVFTSTTQFFNSFTLPDFSALFDPTVYIVAATIAIIASLETLLSLDAVDKLDPYKRIAPQSRELKAQGLGNTISGLIGGLPITAVIVRSSANVSSGAKSKMSAIIHGFLLLGSVILIPRYLNLIPLASLAAILLLIGYKLTNPKIYKNLLAQGYSQFIPFIITIIAIMFTDLLRGIIVGMIVGIVYVIKTNLHEAMDVSIEGNKYTLRLNKDVSFLNKAKLRHTLESVPPGATVIFDGSKSVFVDHDIIETIQDFEYTADFNDITVLYIRTNDAKVPFFSKKNYEGADNNLKATA